MEKDKLINFIEINHHFMTVSEMAEETKHNSPLIKRICDDNGWQPMTIQQRMKEFIEANRHLSLEDQAEKANLTTSGLKHHYEVLGIPLPYRERKNKKLAV